jgi:hypothetical protein
MASLTRTHFASGQRAGTRDPRLPAGPLDRVLPEHQLESSIGTACMLTKASSMGRTHDFNQGRGAE